MAHAYCAIGGVRRGRDVVEVPVEITRGHKAAWRARGGQDERGSKVQWVAGVGVDAGAVCGWWTGLLTE